MGVSNFGVDTWLRGIWDFLDPGIGPVFPSCWQAILNPLDTRRSLPYFSHFWDGEMSGMQAFVAYIPVPLAEG